MNGSPAGDPLTAGRSAQEEPPGADLVIRTRSATPAETAAVTAVISSALAEATAADPLAPPARSGWERSARAIRRPLAPREGNWTTFTG